MMSEKNRSYLYLLVTFFLWGSLYVVSKYVLGKMPTFTVAFGRYLIAFAALTLMTARRPEKVKIDKADYKYIFIIGFLGYSVSVGMQLIGTKLAGSSMASLINSMNPVTISIMAALILKERLTVPKVAGIMLSLCGVYLLIGTGADISILGVLCSLGAVLGWSFMSVITRKVTSKYDALTITRAATGITVICNLPICIGEMCITGQRIQPDMLAFLGLLYLGLFCTALTLVLWNKSLSQLPASVCSAFYPLQPLTSSVLGVLLFHETTDLSFVAGFALIVAGVLISLLVKEPKRFFMNDRNQFFRCRMKRI